MQFVTANTLFFFLILRQCVCFDGWQHNPLMLGASPSPIVQSVIIFIWGCFVKWFEILQEMQLTLLSHFCLGLQRVASKMTFIVHQSDVSSELVNRMHLGPNLTWCQEMTYEIDFSHMGLFLLNENPPPRPPLPFTHEFGCCTSTNDFKCNPRGESVANADWG